MPKKRTEHFGADEERQAWTRKVKRTLDDIDSGVYSAQAGLERLQKWGKARVARFRKSKGGL